MIMTRSSLVRAAVLLIALPVACVDAAQAKRGSWHARGGKAAQTPLTGGQNARRSRLQSLWRRVDKSSAAGGTCAWTDFHVQLIGASLLVLAWLLSFAFLELASLDVFRRICQDAFAGTDINSAGSLHCRFSNSPLYIAVLRVYHDVNASSLGSFCFFVHPPPEHLLAHAVNGYGKEMMHTARGNVSNISREEFVHGMMKLYEIWLLRSRLFLFSLLGSAALAFVITEDVVVWTLEIFRTISVAEETGTVVLPFTSECQSLLIYNQVPMFNLQVLIWAGVLLGPYVVLPWALTRMDASIYGYRTASETLGYVRTLCSELFSLCTSIFVLAAYGAIQSLNVLLRAYGVCSLLCVGVWSTVMRRLPVSVRPAAFLTEEEQFQRDVEEQRKLFRRLDADGNGELSKEEFKAMPGCEDLPQEEIDAFFYLIDTDHNGSISEDEFLKFFAT
jgi:hypothetical protein